MPVTNMAGPVGMRVPLNPTALDLLMAGAEVPDLAVLPEYIAMAKEAGPKREKRIQAEGIAFEDEQILAQTRGTLTALHERLKVELGRLLIPSWDQLIDIPDATDSLALSERLRPLEAQIVFVTDTRDRLEVRIAAARLKRLEATLERRKIESFESQLLYAISVLKTETAMAAIRQDEGGAVVFGKRSIALREASLEAGRQVALAEAALRDERNRQVTAANAQMATGTVTRAQVASAVAEYQA